VVDISHDAPIYETRTLTEGGITYYKSPTVSKIPPTEGDVEAFVALINRIRKGATEADPSTPSQHPQPTPKATGIHCHYGYNRTGFLICAYLIQQEGWSVEDAIREFAAKKPPGIKHAHFVDALFVRYCVGLRRRGTMIVVEDDGGEGEGDRDGGVRELERKRDEGAKDDESEG
jgi:hypothetical protein